MVVPQLGEALSSLNLASSPAMAPGKGASGSKRKAKAKAAAISYPTSLPTDEKAAFLEVCDVLSKEVLDEFSTVHGMPAEAVQWIKDMIEYNVKGGKLNRGLTVVDVKRTLEAVSGSGPLSTRDFARASVLGWCIEWLQAFFLVADDVMDDSVTRRGQPCWFRLPHVKLIAINDSFILESNVFQLLKRHFGHEDYYLDLVELFREVIIQTELGQLLDLTSQPMDKPADLARFTIDRYRLIVKYKTAFYTFYLPIACGLIMSGVSDEESLATAQRICLIMGEYFQIQDDYLDCYGDPKVIGKVGTDIQDNKCSWLVVQALDRATSEQKAVLKEHYGKHAPESVSKVKALYVSLGLEALFKSYEEASYKDMMREMDHLPASLPRSVFEGLLNKIYKRAK